MTSRTRCRPPSSCQQGGPLSPRGARGTWQQAIGQEGQGRLPPVQRGHPKGLGAEEAHGGASEAARRPQVPELPEAVQVQDGPQQRPEAQHSREPQEGWQLGKVLSRGRLRCPGGAGPPSPASGCPHHSSCTSCPPRWAALPPLLRGARPRTSSPPSRGRGPVGCRADPQRLHLRCTRPRFHLQDTVKAGLARTAQVADGRRPGAGDRAAQPTASGGVEGRTESRTGTTLTAQ